MKLFLHIGPHKTGTTSVQNFFYDHRKELNKRGLLYPAYSLYDKQHLLLPLKYLPKNQLYESLRGEHMAHTVDGFVNSLRSCRSEFIFLSSEAFSELIVRDMDSFSEIMRKLTKMFDVEILYLKRDLFDLSISAYKHLIRILDNTNIEYFRQHLSVPTKAVYENFKPLIFYEYVIKYLEQLVENIDNLNTKVRILNYEEGMAIENILGLLSEITQLELNFDASKNTRNTSSYRYNKNPYVDMVYEKYVRHFDNVSTFVPMRSIPLDTHLVSDLDFRHNMRNIFNSITSHD